MADEKPDPIVEMLAVDESARAQPLPEAELNVDAPADKQAPERDETGKFKGKGDEKPDPDKKPDTKAADPKVPEEKPKETVPLATFLEKTNKLKEQLDAKDITLKQYEQRLAALEAKANPPKQPDPEPDYVEDPKGYVDHKQKAILEAIAEANKKAEETGKKAEETAVQAAEQVQIQRFLTDLQAHEARFIQANPDYHDALAHIRTIRAAQIREFNPEVTDQQIVQAIRQEETQLAIQLARQGRDPVQTAYNLAKHSGYQSKAKPGAQDDPLKLPEPANKRLPPDQTLGSGAGGGEDAPVYKDGEADPVDLALASLFRKRA